MFKTFLGQAYKFVFCVSVYNCSYFTEVFETETEVQIYNNFQ